MSTLTRRNGSVIDQFLRDWPVIRTPLDINDGFFNAGPLMPDVNIIENDKDFRIELAAPGLERKDFKVEVAENVLTISVEKKKESSEEKENYRRKEFSYSSFSRSFSLPNNSLSDKIDAKYEKGILFITLPKREVSISKPVREIAVS